MGRKKMMDEKMDEAIEAAKIVVENISKMVNRVEHCNDDDDCEVAEADLQKTPFEVEVRSDWYATDDGQSPRPHEYRILLTIGEPAVRIVGELGEDSVPVSACVQYQDGNESWVYYNDMSHEEHANLLTFAQNFTY